MNVLMITENVFSFNINLFLKMQIKLYKFVRWFLLHSAVRPVNKLAITGINACSHGVISTTPWTYALHPAGTNDCLQSCALQQSTHIHSLSYTHKAKPALAYVVFPSQPQRHTHSPSCMYCTLGLGLTSPPGVELRKCRPALSQWFKHTHTLNCL